MTEDILELIRENVIQGRVAQDDEGFKEGMVGQPGLTELAEKALAQGISPKDIINKGLTAGMNIVGQKFEAKEYYIPDMLASAEAVGVAMELLEPHLAKSGLKSKGKIIVATVKGDLHDIGKNIVSILLRGAGYTPVTYVGQTFNPQEFPPEKMRRFDRTPPTVLLVGIFEADVKGIRETLVALNEVHRSGTEFRLRRISTWPLSKEEKSIFVAHKYDIRLTPFEMGQAYRNSDLLIGPSHPEEGFDLPVLEGLSSGLPALLSDTPGHRYVARTAAEYFPCGDTAALVSSLSRLLTNPSRRAELSAAGPVEAVRFRTSGVARKLFAAFEKALTK